MHAGKSSELVTLCVTYAQLVPEPDLPRSIPVSFEDNRKHVSGHQTLPFKQVLQVRSFGCFTPSQLGACTFLLIFRKIRFTHQSVVGPNVRMGTMQDVLGPLD